MGTFYNVATQKKKIIAFLLVVTLGGGAMVLCSGKSPSAEQKKLPSYGSYSVSESDSNRPGKSVDVLDTREMFHKMMFAVLLVIVLGVGAIQKNFCRRLPTFPVKISTSSRQSTLGRVNRCIY